MGSPGKPTKWQPRRLGNPVMSPAHQHHQQLQQATQKALLQSFVTLTSPARSMNWTKSRELSTTLGMCLPKELPDAAPGGAGRSCSRPFHPRLAPRAKGRRPLRGLSGDRSGRRADFLFFLSTLRAAGKAEGALPAETPSHCWFDLAAPGRSYLNSEPFS